jgi:prolipoprotein diacylglyceryltransferase
MIDVIIKITVKYSYHLFLIEHYIDLHVLFFIIFYNRYQLQTQRKSQTTKRRDCDYDKRNIVNFLLAIEVQKYSYHLFLIEHYIDLHVLFFIIFYNRYHNFHSFQCKSKTSHIS